MSESGPGNPQSSNFECNICFESASDPVVTLCGHLYCWKHLHEWLKRSNQCPVCKAGVTRENVVPLYGRGNSDDPRNKEDTPERPRAQRPTAQPRHQGFGGFFPPFMGNPGGRGMNFAFGFPPFFVFQGGMQQHNPVNRSREEEHQLYFSRIMFMIGLMLLLYVISVPI